MSYLVLARKYRPRSFEELVGQEHVVQALSNALTQQRLHHAYLFTGTRGVGKTTVSRILAKSLNCVGPDGEGGITATPCGVCHACRDIDSGRFVDYVELDAASNRGVEEISQLLDQAVYKPVVGRFKVYMVDEVHMLSSHAFNAMLKTLEEPPEYLKFVLATTDPQKVPATVLSRCLQFNLRPIPPVTVQAHLVDVLAREHIEAEPAALRLLSRGARGSMRDALSLTDQAIAFGAGRLEEAGVRQMLGAVDRSHVVRIVEALSRADGAALIAAVDGLRALGLSAAGTLEEMAAMLQQMAVLQAVPDALDVDDPDSAVAMRLSSLLAADETQLVYSIVLHGRAELGLAPDEYSGLVMLLLRMLAFRAASGSPARGAAPATAAAPSGASPASRPVLQSASQPVASSAVRSEVANEAPAEPARRPVAPSAEPARKPFAPSAEPPAVARPAARPLAVTPPAARAQIDMPEPPPWDEVPGDYESTVAEQAPAAPSRPMARPRADSSPARQVGAMPGRGMGGQATAGNATSANAMPSNALSASADPRDDGSQRPESGPVVRQPSTPTVAAPVATPFGDRWAEVVKALIEKGAIAALVRELAMQAQCVAIESVSAGDGAPPVWRLCVERETLRSTTHCDKLQAALAALLGGPVRLQVEAGVAQDSPARREAAERARRLAEAEDIIHNDPVVIALMQQYKTARIVPGSIKAH